ncbi:MAG: molybdopterin cofactor-binding domain-containing protein, partial [Flavitalea sp.]
MANQTRNKSTGKPMDRVDGRLKVTGGAKYFADQQVVGLTYASIVTSTIAKGSIKKLNAQKALAAPGVLSVISHLNAPPIPGFQDNIEAKKNNEDKVQELKIFKDNRIYSSGQPIAIVVADTLERAVYAASLVTVEYDKETSQTDLLSNIEKGVPPDEDADYTRGDAQAVDHAAFIVNETYTSPTEIHNPMELAGIIAMWEGEKLKVFVKTQGVKDHQKSLHETFKIPIEDIQVNSEFVGGAFGMSLRVWPHEIAAIVAAKQIKRPVKLVIGRNDMFTMVGYRPQAIQKMKTGSMAKYNYGI